MSQKLTIKDVIHILEKDHGFKIYKKGNKYSVWYKGWNAPLSMGRKLGTARDIHRMYTGYLKGIPWNDIVKRQTHAVSRRIVRDAIHNEEFEKIPQHDLPYKEDPWNYD
jgi:hypothetical protein